PFSGNIRCSKHRQPHQTKPGQLFSPGSRDIEQIPAHDLPHYAEGHHKKDHDQNSFGDFIEEGYHDLVRFSICSIKPPITGSFLSRSFNGLVASLKDSASGSMISMPCSFRNFISFSTASSHNFFCSTSETSAASWIQLCSSALRVFHTGMPITRTSGSRVCRSNV